MTDYIDRKKLRDKLYDEDAITMRGVAIINQFPVADVVPIVRCKDCLFWSANTNPDDGWGWCCNSAIGEKDREENFFCAYGARKE